MTILAIAHRGYSEKYPENTLVAFKEAIALGSPAIELDVHLSKDHELVVTHDFKLGRMVKAPGYVSDYTAAELGELEGAKVSTLAEVLNLVNHQCLLNIEIKEETLFDEAAYNLMADKLLALLKTYGLKDILFSSFDAFALKTLRAKSREARLALLDDNADRGPRIAEAKELGAEAYNVNLKRITGEQVAELQNAGFKVFTYTAKTIEDLKLAQALKVDGVFSDNLEDALKLFS